MFNSKRKIMESIENGMMIVDGFAGGCCGESISPMCLNPASHCLCQSTFTDF
jgi:hypothetical protein